MDKVAEYQGYIQKILTEYTSHKSINDAIEAQTIFDTKRDHYQLVHVGWQNKRRVYGCVLHLDIKSGEIWIQHDGTEIGIANELVALGVPKTDIVLAFHAPYVRQYTEFAVS